MTYIKVALFFAERSLRSLVETETTRSEGRFFRKISQGVVEAW